MSNEFDSYVVVMVDNGTGAVKTHAEWEAGSTQSELYAKASAAIAAVIAETGHQNYTTHVHLMAA